MLSDIEIAQQAHMKKITEIAASLGIPMTNFGIAIAYMNGIFDRICY